MSYMVEVINWPLTLTGAAVGVGLLVVALFWKGRK